MPRAEESRLIKALEGAKHGVVDTAHIEWNRCGRALDIVATQLQKCSMDVPEGEAGHATSQAMETAFATSAKAMNDRAEALRGGAEALRLSAKEIKSAQDAHAALGAEPGVPGDFKPVDDDPTSDKSIKARKDYDAGVADYEAKMAHREAVSKKHADQLDTTFTASSATMKEIHGEPDPQPEKAPSSGGSNPGGRTPVTPTGHPPAGPTDSGPWHPPKGPTDTGPKGPTGPVDWPTNNNNNDPTTGGPGPVPTNDPPPDWWYDHGGSGDPTGSGTSTGGGLTSVGGAVGAGAGVAGGGIAAAALSGGLRGVLGGGVVPTSGVSGASGAGGRAIGTGARASSSGVLGRTGTSTSGASGVAGRSGTGARGAGAAGRGASSRAGGKAGAGARGAGGRGGAGAAGRGKGDKDDEKGKAHELFDVDEDWTGDEDGAPPVLQ